jgi:hypothetical protein
MLRYRSLLVIDPAHTLIALPDGRVDYSQDARQLANHFVSYSARSRHSKPAVLKANRMASETSVPSKYPHRS